MYLKRSYLTPKIYIITFSNDKILDSDFRNDWDVIAPDVKW